MTKVGAGGTAAMVTTDDPGLDEEGIVRRKAYLGLGASDVECLRALAGHATAGQEAFLGRFYNHLALFGETAAVLGHSDVPLESIRVAHGDQLAALLSGQYDAGYAADRARIGQTHHRAGLKPEWSIGAYGQYLGWLLPLAAKVAGKDSDRFLATVMALVKVVLLDVDLTLNGYFQADHERFRLLAKVFESDLEAVLICDPTGTIAEANHMTAAISGYSPGDIAGRGLDFLYAARNVEPFAEIWNQVLTRDACDIARRAPGGGFWHGRVWHRHAAGHDYLAQMSVAAVGNEYGRVTHYVVEYADVTEEWRAEQALKARTEELDRSNKELEQFAYVASHDLQEPLRMVASYTQLLSRRYKGKLDQNADEFIAFAADGAIRMQGLINDLLKYSRVGTHGRPFLPVAVERILLDAMANLKVAIEESGTLIDHDPLPVLTGDATQLTQLLQNLIGNAIKFRKAGTTPAIHIGARRVGDGWEFSVRDNGIGIQPEHFERIFVIFQRLNAREEYPGSGIGLALCRKIVERHHGRIWVESRAGEGTTFHFVIPDRAVGDDERQ